MVNSLCKSQGVVHFWDLPNTLHVRLNNAFRAKLLDDLIRFAGSQNEAGRLIQTSGATIRNYLRGHPVQIDFLINIARALKRNPEEIESNITWIGDHRHSKGLLNPRLPFDFKCKAGARILAAICNDGWISDGAYYSNSEEDLRCSVKRDALTVFGGDEDCIRIWIKDKDQYLSFPSVIRDVLVIVTDFKGVKSENNPGVPTFVMESKDLMCAWLEQTIADEGCVKHYPSKYRREIIWTRSFREDLNEYKLHLDELRMLQQLGLEYKVYDVGRYKTAKGVAKIRRAIRIAKRQNLLRLRQMIRIPCKRKDKIFTELFHRFVRYKEPLKVREMIARICKNTGYVTSTMLKKEMCYKQIGNAIKWLRLSERDGFVKCIGRKRGGGYKVGIIPAKYVLNA